MDPATIGLLISIAPTVLDLLFSGRRVTFGHVRRTNIIKHETIPKKMYGYGLEEGYGYRYPPLEQYARLPYQTTRGVIEKIVRVPTKKWAAVYFLNKRAVAKNKWVNFLRKKMDNLRDEYYKEVGKKKPKRVERIRHKLMTEAIKRMPELAAIEKLPEEELIKLYYEGAVPRSRKQNEKLYKILELPAEQQVLVPVAKK
jgi:hypothetical protein